MLRSSELVDTRDSSASSGRFPSAFLLSGRFFKKAKNLLAISLGGDTDSLFRVSMIKRRVISALYKNKTVPKPL